MMDGAKKREQILEALRNDPTLTLREAAEDFDVSPSYIHKLKQVVKNEATFSDDADLYSVDQALKIQKLRDTQRIERREFREEARALNSRNGLLETLIDLMTNLHKRVPKKRLVKATGGTLVLQFSDLHFGETVELPNNIVNTNIISARLYEFVHRAIAIGKAFNVRRCVVALTGDIVNSDRRTSELMSNEFNRAHAIMNAFEVLSQAIDVVDSEVPVTNVVSVIGNESRIDKDFAFETRCLTNNFDYILHEMLRAYFGEIKCSEWGNPVERLLSIDGILMMLSHGITKCKASPANQLSYYRAKYGRVDYLIEGHLHEALGAPGFARSGSVIGGNGYSELGLGIPTSTPSQSCHVIDDMKVFSFPIDLTSVCGDVFTFTKPPESAEVARVREEI
jgi:hypothetical protein